MPPHIIAISGCVEARLVSKSIKMSELVQDSVACNYQYDETFIPLICQLTGGGKPITPLLGIAIPIFGAPSGSSFISIWHFRSRSLRVINPQQKLCRGHSPERGADVDDLLSVCLTSGAIRDSNTSKLSDEHYSQCLGLNVLSLPFCRSTIVCSPRAFELNVESLGIRFDS